MNGGGGTRHHDAPPPPHHHHRPPQQQQRQRHPPNEQPPPYSRYPTAYETLEKRWGPKTSQTITAAPSQQQQHQHQPAHSSSSMRGSNLNASSAGGSSSSFAEKRRLQERREFDNAHWPSTTEAAAAAAGIAYNDDTLLRRRRQNNNSQPPKTNDTVRMNNNDLQNILTSAVGSTAANNVDNETMSTTSSSDGARGEVVAKTSITLANYSPSGKRLGDSSRQKFVVNGVTAAAAGASVTAAASAGGVHSSLAASSSAPAAAAAAAGAMKPSSILKRSSLRPSSIVKTTSYSSSAAQPPASSSLSSNQQHQVHNSNKVDWGDNSTREIEHRLSPVMFNVVPAANPAAAAAAAAGGGSNNNYNRRNSNDLPPNNHNNNFIRRGSGGSAHPQPPPPNNTNTYFNRRNSGGNGSRPPTGPNAPCRLEEHKGLHKWKDCPNNPHSDNYNDIHHRTASHQQLLDSVQLERQQFEKQRQQQQQQQQRQKAMNMHGQEANNANRSRAEQHPPTVVASSSLKRPISAVASKPNSSSSAVAAARSSEASNLFNTTKSARTQMASQHQLKPSAAASAGGGSIPRSPIPKKQMVILHETQKLRHLKQTNEFHTSIVHAIPRKPPPPQQQKKKKVEPPRMQQQQQQKNSEFKNGRFQKRTSHDVAPSGQDAVPIAKQTSGRLVTKARKQPSSWPGGGEDATSVAHRTTNIIGNTAGKDYDTDESHHTIMDDEMEVDDFSSNNDSIDNDNGDKEKAEPATPSFNSSGSIGLKITRDPAKNSGSSNREKKKRKKDHDNEKVEDKKKKEDDKVEKKKKKKKDDDNEMKEDTKKKEDDKVEKKDEDDEMKEDKNKKEDDKVEKKDKKKDDDVEMKQDKKKKEDDKVEKKKKKPKKECKKPGCTTKRLKGNKFCKAHATASKKPDAASADGIDSLSAISAKPAAALKEAENNPSKKVKAKKRGVKRKSPPEPTLDEPSLIDDNDVPVNGTSSANKRQAQEICLSSENQNPSDQLANDEDQLANDEDLILPDLEDGEIGEMETDLFNLLDETIKIRYQDYVEQNEITEDLLSTEQSPLEMRTGEVESPPDECSLSKEAPSQNEVETRDKENMSSAVLNSLTDRASRDTGDDSEDDDQIPLFYTCDKCDRVFFARSQAAEHENQCTKEVLDGREFTNPNDIAEYYEKNQTGGEMKSDCVIFYRPPLTTPHDNSGRTISPEDFEGRGVNRNDLPQNLLDDFMSSKSPKATSGTKEKKIENDFKIDPNNTRHACEVMNAVECLSSTVINPDSGLPRQTLTTLCRETGKGIALLISLSVKF